MLSPLSNLTYRHLFLAQVLSLLGTGLATVALGLLAYELAGADAGAVLGTALAIKMIAYVGIAPVAGAFVHLVPRRSLLVTLDLLRAGVAVCLPFVTEIWQVYLLIFLLQAGSAAFTPTFQATIPDILPEEAEYTKALSLSRLAYDLEALASPAIAAALLGVIGFHWLFGLNALGFLASAVLVLSVVLPSPKPPTTSEGAWGRTTRGARIYLATPRLRGLLALNLAAAAAGAMVIVNTVVLVRAGFGLGEREVAWTLAAYGLGSMVAALALPRLLACFVPVRQRLCLCEPRSHGHHRAAPARRSDDRPERDAGRRRAPGHWAAAGAPGAVMAGAAAGLGAARPRQRACADAERAAAAALRASRRPAGAVRRTVRTEPRLLAADLSAGRRPRRSDRARAHFPGAGRAGGGRARCGGGAVAAG